MKNLMKLKIIGEIKELLIIVRNLDKKVITIFLSVAVLQTISWYYTSRSFFRMNIFPKYQTLPNIYLYEYVFWFIGDFFTFLVLPVLLIKFLLKEKVKNYGFIFGDYKTGIKISILFLAVMLPIVWFASSTIEFSSAYPHLVSARDSWYIFFIFEAGMFLYMIAWEFIWRGFMLFGLEGKFGYYAVLIQMIPFLILHNGKPAAETFGAIIAGIALGILALRTRSFFYGIFAHFGVMFSIDLISSLRHRSGDFGIGISSVINILKQIF